MGTTGCSHAPCARPASRPSLDWVASSSILIRAASFVTAKSSPISDVPAGGVRTAAMVDAGYDECRPGCDPLNRVLTKFRDVRAVQRQAGGVRWISA